jgi:hypothetical protein
MPGVWIQHCLKSFSKLIELCFCCIYVFVSFPILIQESSSKIYTKAWEMHSTENMSTISKNLSHGEYIRLYKIMSYHE